MRVIPQTSRAAGAKRRNAIASPLEDERPAKFQRAIKVLHSLGRPNFLPRFIFRAGAPASV